MPESPDDALGFLSASSLDAVLTMPWAPEVGYELLASEAVAAGLQRLINTWNPILKRDSSFCNEPIAAEDEAWRTASLRLAGHFAEALHYAEPALTSGHHPWSPFTRSFQRNILSVEYGTSAAIERRLISEFSSGYHAAYFTEVIGSAALWPAGTGWDLFSFWSIGEISKYAMFSEHIEHLQMGNIFTRGVAERGKLAAENRDRNDVKMREELWGPLISYRELGALARRSELMIERYGEKKIEERFEQQLSVLFQSFGFIVASTSRGQRRVDLVCIAAQDDSGPYTVLIEAKTTASPYTLPTKDSRALQEYVQTHKSKLKTLPPLKLVLIVGQEPARTVELKIRQLGALSNVPVRYCDANLLAGLRTSFVGALPPLPFLEAVMSSGAVLSAEVIEMVTKGIRENADAHADFIKRLIS